MLFMAFAVFSIGFSRVDISSKTCAGPERLRHVAMASPEALVVQILSLSRGVVRRKTCQDTWKTMGKLWKTIENAA